MVHRVTLPPYIIEQKLLPLEKNTLENLPNEIDKRAKPYWEKQLQPRGTWPNYPSFLVDDLLRGY